MTLDICFNTVGGELSGGWQHIGNYKMVCVKWLSKSYSKLGNFLHLTSLADDEAPPQINTSDLQAILNEIKRVSTADILLAMTLYLLWNAPCASQTCM